MARKINAHNTIEIGTATTQPRKKFKPSSRCRGKMGISRPPLPQNVSVCCKLMLRLSSAFFGEMTKKTSCPWTRRREVWEVVNYSWLCLAAGLVARLLGELIGLVHQATH